jgi:hypothetical protein
LGEGNKFFVSEPEYAEGDVVTAVMVDCFAPMAYVTVTFADLAQAGVNGCSTLDVAGDHTALTSCANLKSLGAE